MTRSNPSRWVGRWRFPVANRPCRNTATDQHRGHLFSNTAARAFSETNTSMTALQDTHPPFASTSSVTSRGEILTSWPTIAYRTAVFNPLKLKSNDRSWTSVTEGTSRFRRGRPFFASLRNRPITCPETRDSNITGDFGQNASLRPRRRSLPAEYFK